LTWEEVWKLFKYRENFKPNDSEKPIVTIKPQPVKPISPPVKELELKYYEKRCLELFKFYDRNSDSLIQFSEFSPLYLAVHPNSPFVKA
jgi:hypothetical protein